MAIDIIRDITNAIKGQISTTLPATYGEIAYVEAVEKNNFRQSKDKYGVRALAAGETPGVTKEVTIAQDFEIVLTTGYRESRTNDSKQVEDSLDLRAEVLDIYKTLVNNRAGLPLVVLNVSDLILSEPEYLEDDKVVVIRANMNILYRYSLI